MTDPSIHLAKIVETANNLSESGPEHKGELMEALITLTREYLDNGGDRNRLEKMLKGK